MRLSAPIYKLKRHAKLLARNEHLPLHRALDRVAASEGFQNWSHLAASWASQGHAVAILNQLSPGDMMLIGARPGQGKTLLAIELAVAAQHAGRASRFFTLDYNQRDVTAHLKELGLHQSGQATPLDIDTSDDICASYIMDRVGAGAVAIVDYLQLLDQKRTNPSLQDQIAALRAFATKTGAIIVLISQVDRTFELRGKPVPDLSDIRLPNPVDLSLFDKACFLHDGEVHFQAAA